MSSSITVIFHQLRYLMWSKKKNVVSSQWWKLMFVFEFIGDILSGQRIQFYKQYYFSYCYFDCTVLFLDFILFRGMYLISCWIIIFSIAYLNYIKRVIYNSWYSSSKILMSFCPHCIAHVISSYVDNMLLYAQFLRHHCWNFFPYPNKNLHFRNLSSFTLWIIKRTSDTWKGPLLHLNQRHFCLCSVS